MNHLHCFRKGDGVEIIVKSKAVEAVGILRSSLALDVDHLARENVLVDLVAKLGGQSQERRMLPIEHGA